jgi:hypothetical protein
LSELGTVPDLRDIVIYQKWDRPKTRIVEMGLQYERKRKKGE